MRLFIRAHDLGVTGADKVLKEIDRLGLDGVQLVVFHGTLQTFYIITDMSKRAFHTDMHAKILRIIAKFGKYLDNF